MSSIDVGVIVTVVIFVVTQIFLMAKFMTATQMQVTEITRCLRQLEADVKALATYDREIRILHERMNQSQADRREIWIELRHVRDRVAEINVHATGQ